MTRVWKIIALALTSGYLLAGFSCNSDAGLDFIPNIPGGTSVVQTIQNLLAT